jgi:hypothetical protein
MTEVEILREVAHEWLDRAERAKARGDKRRAEAYDRVAFNVQNAQLMAMQAEAAKEKRA